MKNSCSFSSWQTNFTLNSNVGRWKVHDPLTSHDVSEVHHGFSFPDVEAQVVVFAPLCENRYLVQVGLLVIVGYQQCCL